MENGELFEKGSGYYVLSEERFRRAQWFVVNYPGLPARNQQTGKFLWPYVPAEEPDLSNDSASTSNPLAKLESSANKPGEYSSKLLLESQTEHAECKEMMKKLDEAMYVARLYIIHCIITLILCINLYSAEAQNQSNVLHKANGSEAVKLMKQLRDSWCVLS